MYGFIVIVELNLSLQPSVKYWRFVFPRLIFIKLITFQVCVILPVMTLPYFLDWFSEQNDQVTCAEYYLHCFSFYRFWEVINLDIQSLYKVVLSTVLWGRPRWIFLYSEVYLQYLMVQNFCEMNSKIQLMMYPRILGFMVYLAADLSTLCHKSFGSQ